jgi:acetyl esterase/lipase
VYRAYTKEQRSDPDIVTLDVGTSGAWIGPSKAKKVFIYFHGGGYTSPAYPEHMNVLGELVVTARTQGKDFSVFVVEYGLSSVRRDDCNANTSPQALHQRLNTRCR